MIEIPFNLFRWLCWLSFVSACAIPKGLAQHWLPTDIPGAYLNLQAVWSNTTQDTIYCAGWLPMDSIPWSQNNPVMRYTNGVWDQIGRFNNVVLTMTHYGDTLVVGGAFTSVSGILTHSVVGFVDGVQIPYGNLEGTVRKLKVIDGELFAVGGFQIIEEDTSYFVAKRSNGLWVGVGDFENGSSGTLIDIEKYNNELVVAGFVSNSTGGRIFRNNGGTWQALGPGIIGALSGAKCLATFQGSLYVAGQIKTSEGNAGENIMRWDGNQFNPVGDGIRLTLGTSNTATITSMIVQDDLLYVGGGYLFTDSMPSNGLSTWDGSSWCVMPGNIFPEADGIYGMAFYKDTLFLGTHGYTIDGVFTNGVAKANGELSPDTCKLPVSIREQLADQDLVLYPTPCQSSFQITGTLPGDKVSIVDALGRTVRSYTLKNKDQTIEFPFPSGPYTVIFFGKNGLARAFKLIRTE